MLFAGHYGLLGVFQSIYLPQREAAQSATRHAGRPEKPGGLHPHVLQVSLDFDGAARRAKLFQLARREPHRRLGEGAHKPRVSHLRQTEFGGRRPYRFQDEHQSASGRWEMWMDGAQARAVRTARRN